eukprot:1160599-Pelagomonas_calceolata.AAC.9
MAVPGGGQAPARFPKQLCLLLIQRGYSNKVCWPGWQSCFVAHLHASKLIYAIYLCHINIWSCPHSSTLWSPFVRPLLACLLACLLDRKPFLKARSLCLVGVASRHGKQQSMHRETLQGLINAVVMALYGFPGLCHLHAGAKRRRFQSGARQSTRNVPIRAISIDKKSHSPGCLCMYTPS